MINQILIHLCQLTSTIILNLWVLPKYKVLQTIVLVTYFFVNFFFLFFCKKSKSLYNYIKIIITTYVSTTHMKTDLIFPPKYVSHTFKNIKSTYIIIKLLTLNMHK